MFRALQTVADALAIRLVTVFSLVWAAHLVTVDLGGAGVDLQSNATLPAMLGLLLPMGITEGNVVSVQPPTS